MIDFYTARAIGGCGLIYTEVCRVNEEHGAAMLRQLSLTSDRNIERMSMMTAAVHKYDTRMFCQLHHPGRETYTILTGGKPVVSASDVMCKFAKQPTRALENAEVKSLVQDFINAAVRAKEGGLRRGGAACRPRLPHRAVLLALHQQAHGRVRRQL
jgi:2,4-dienoyl-CoA reductase-like NADH-dependent reductase (Old Yellow Enzyme family)